MASRLLDAAFVLLCCSIVKVYFSALRRCGSAGSGNGRWAACSASPGSLCTSEKTLKVAAVQNANTAIWIRNCRVVAKENGRQILRRKPIASVSIW